MNDNKYIPGSILDPRLLLQYLIERADELSQKRFSWFPLPFRGLGAAVLGPFPELREAFLQIEAPSEAPLSERAVKCKAIFLDAMEYASHDRYLQDYADTDGEMPRFGRLVSTQFAWEARRCGEDILYRNDFQFVQVWECLVFIALRGDAEKLRDFQETCVQFPDPKARIDRISPILLSAMTRKDRTAPDETD